MPPDALSQRLWHELKSQTKEHAFIFLDPRGAVVGWAGAAPELFGYQEDEVLGAPGALIFTPEDVAKGLDEHELATARRDSRSEDDRWHVRKDGLRIWVHGTVDPIRAPDGELLGFVKIVRDRTDARMQHEALENALDEAVASRSRTLEFIRTLGHEMRNPLAPLLNAAHVVERLSEDARLRRMADIIRSQVGALGRMADDLMSLARLDSGQLELRTEVVDLRQVLEAAVAGFAGLAAERGVRLEAIVPGGPLQVALDPARFQQVLLNLVSNAIKYTPRDGRVWCKATQEGSEVVLRVEDTGMGIDPEVLPRIFELFSRERRARDHEPGGLGVGLSIAHRIVSLHGGTIVARSAGQDKGAEFAVRLPAA